MQCIHQWNKPHNVVVIPKTINRALRLVTQHLLEQNKCLSLIYESSFDKVIEVLLIHMMQFIMKNLCNIFMKFSKLFLIASSQIFMWFLSGLLLVLTTLLIWLLLSLIAGEKYFSWFLCCYGWLVHHRGLTFSCESFCLDELLVSYPIEDFVFQSISGCNQII